MIVLQEVMQKEKAYSSLSVNLSLVFMLIKLFKLLKKTPQEISLNQWEETLWNWIEVKHYESYLSFNFWSLRCRIIEHMFPELNFD